MLLAVLDLARSGRLTVNEINYGPELLDRYNRYFAAVQAPGDHPNAYFPFFHLSRPLASREPSFWHLVAHPGAEAALGDMSSARSHADITGLIAFARLDEELFHLLQNEANIEVLAETLAQHWFSRGLEDLAAVAVHERQISLYERRLRMAPPPHLLLAEPGEAVRSPAFRRVVLEIYERTPPPPRPPRQDMHIHRFQIAITKNRLNAN